MSLTIPHYRPDIDGLRAVAVLSVLLFHAFPQALPGGFVGVDIFFVISGYLISGILFKEAREGRFSVLQFYIRRARRLLPALLTVLAVVLVAGWLLMFPSEWRALGKHVLAGALFISNGALWQESGYFDSSSDLKPLLHLWSLAVEEQFYLVWPLALALVARRGARALTWVTGGGLLLSLAASVVLTPRNPTLAFYLPLTRFWELLAGSGLAIWQDHTRSEAGFGPPNPGLAHTLSLAGLACLVAALALLQPATPFPGYAAVLPVLGTTLLIAAGPQALVNRWVLAHRGAVLIGLISYPLYLWHWPVLVLARLWAEGDAVPTASLILLLGGAVGLAWLTYRFVELPVRDTHRHARAAADARNLWLLLLALGVIGIGAWQRRLPAHAEQFERVRQIDQAESDWLSIGDQTWVGGQPGVVLFVGDSHMQHYAPRIVEIMRTRQPEAHTVRLMALSGCAPVPGLNRRSVDCARFTDAAFRAMQDPAVVTIVLAASWKGFSVRPDYYRSDDPTHQPVTPLSDAAQWVIDGWRDRLSQLVQAGKHVVVVLSSPRGPLVEPKHLVHRHLWLWDEGLNGLRSQQALKAVVQDVDARVAAAARQAGAEVIDPFSDFCAGETCQVTRRDGSPIFMDDSHIRGSHALEQVHILDPYFFRH